MLLNKISQCLKNYRLEKERSHVQAWNSTLEIGNGKENLPVKEMLHILHCVRSLNALLKCYLTLSLS